MKKRLMLLFASASCLFLSTCLSIDTNGLLDLGSDAFCEIMTSTLPWSGQIDYCSVINVDLNSN